MADAAARYEVVVYPGVRHAFTQPYAKEVASESIAYDAEADRLSWAALLNEAVTKPGFIHEAYSRFHNYSLGNQLLALFQCMARGIQPGPLGTFSRRQ